MLSERICAGCTKELPKNSHACFCCAEPLAENTVDFLCGHCQQGRRPFWRCVAPLLYCYPVAEILQAMKYRQNLAYAVPLSRVLADAVKKTYEKDSWPEVMMPMPLHHSRLVERGYNQAGILVRHLSSLLNLPVEYTSVSRVKATPPLLHFSAKARRRVLAGSFSSNAMAFKHVALVDDIMTSGASVEAVSNVLKRAGVRRVDVWCVARTPSG